MLYSSENQENAGRCCHCHLFVSVSGTTMIDSKAKSSTQPPRHPAPRYPAASPAALPTMKVLFRFITTDNVLCCGTSSHPHTYRHNILVHFMLIHNFTSPQYVMLSFMTKFNKTRPTCLIRVLNVWR